MFLLAENSHSCGHFIFTPLSLLHVLIISSYKKVQRSWWAGELLWGHVIVVPTAVFGDIVCTADECTGAASWISFSAFPLTNSGFVAALNCTSPTPKALLHALESSLLPEKRVRPVKSFSDPLNITISITVVGILGVVSSCKTFSFKRLERHGFKSVLNVYYWLCLTDRMKKPKRSQRSCGKFW